MISLETPRLLLRPFELSDADDIARYASNPEFYRFLPIPEQTPETVERFIRGRIAEADGEEDGNRLFFAIVLKDCGAVIGTVRLEVQDLPVPLGSLGFSMDVTQQGEGFMSEAAQAVLDYAFGECGLIRVWSTTDVENDRGVGLLESVGMTRNKVIRAAMTVRGKRRDIFHYSVDAQAYRAAAGGEAGGG